MQTAVNGGSSCDLGPCSRTYDCPGAWDSEGSGLSIALILGLIQTEVQPAVALLAWGAWVTGG